MTPMSRLNEQNAAGVANSAGKPARRKQYVCDEAVFGHRLGLPRSERIGASSRLFRNRSDIHGALSSSIEQILSAAELSGAGLASRTCAIDHPEGGRTSPYISESKKPQPTPVFGRYRIAEAARRFADAVQPWSNIADTWGRRPELFPYCRAESLSCRLTARGKRKSASC